MERYKNRQHAGQVLANYLKDYADLDNVLILALPRGGVPIGYEIARKLHAPLDVFIVRKLGVPGHVELAMGAIAMGDVVVFNDDLIEELQVTEHEVNVVTQREKKELQRREQAYRGNKPFPNVKDKIIILVDDGIATGATMRAAILALKQLKPIKLIVAVPVAAKDTVDKLAKLVDEFVCPLQPLYFQAVGLWYEQFNQTEDEEVHQLLSMGNER